MTVIYERKYPCPCQRGHIITTTTEAQHGPETDYRLECSHCEQAYRVVQLPAVRINAFQHPFAMYVRVVQVNQAEKYKNFYQELYHLQGELIQRSKKLYLPLFMETVLRDDSKRGIWNKLQAIAGEPTRTLKAFYRYTRKRIEEIVRSHFTLDRLPQILQNLQVEDADLQDMLARIEQIQQQIHLLEEEMVRSGHRLESGTTISDVGVSDRIPEMAR